MPQPTINVVNISFVTNHGKVGNHIFKNSNDFVPIAWELCGQLVYYNKSQLGSCSITFTERNGDPNN